MKINSKVVAQKIAVAKATAQSKGGKAQKVTTVNVAKKVAAAIEGKAKVDPLGTHKSYTIRNVKDAIKAGLDGDTVWCGREINDGLVTSLLEQREVLTSTRLPATDKALVIESPDWMRRGATLFAFKLRKLGGDIYERIDPRFGNAVVRGSIKALKAAYGGHVKLVPVDTAAKLLKTLKAHKDSKAAFGVS